MGSYTSELKKFFMGAIKYAEPPACMLLKNGAVIEIRRGNISTFRGEKNFDRYYGLALVMSADESLKRLYNLLNEGEQKELCLACILLRKESAKRTLDFFSEIN